MDTLNEENVTRILEVTTRQLDEWQRSKFLLPVHHEKSSGKRIRIYLQRDVERMSRFLFNIRDSHLPCAA